MPDRTEYRAYTLDPAGHIQRPFDLTAADEQMARKQAIDLAEGQDVELWLGTQRIAKIAHKH
jgi:hypothetical protein